MDITFFDNPTESPNSREDVRIKQVGLFVYEDMRRVAFGVELTPFLEGPSIEVQMTNARGEPAGSLNVIETNTPNFTLTLHLRDAERVDPYTLTAKLYYATPEEERMDVDARTVTFNMLEPGETLFPFDPQR